MESRRLLLLAGIAAATLAGAALAAALLWSMGGEESEPFPEAVDEIQVDTRVAPRTALFGDTVRAHVDVVLDETRVDPGTIRVAADFDPFEVVGRPSSTRRDAGDSVLVRTTYVLRCVSGACVPSGQSEEFQCADTRVSYGAPSDRGVDEDSVSAGWPTMKQACVATPSSRLLLTTSSACS